MSDLPKIEKGIPIPSSSSHKYPFWGMEIDDSFFLTGGREVALQVTSSAGQFRKRNPEFRFLLRKEGAGYRVWRIAVDDAAPAKAKNRGAAKP